MVAVVGHGGDLAAETDHADRAGLRQDALELGSMDSEVGRREAAVREMLTAVPQSERWPLYSLPPMSRWSAGRIVLLGDAAPAMLPHPWPGRESVHRGRCCAR